MLMSLSRGGQIYQNMRDVIYGQPLIFSVVKFFFQVQFDESMKRDLIFWVMIEGNFPIYDKMNSGNCS